MNESNSTKRRPSIARIIGGSLIGLGTMVIVGAAFAFSPMKGYGLVEIAFFGSIGACLGLLGVMLLCIAAIRSRKPI